MEYQKYFKQFCLFAFGTLILYLFITNDSINKIRSLQIPFITKLYSLNSLFAQNISSINQTNDSINDSLSSPKPFESRISDHYPRLPIHIYTQNLTLTGNKTKLILLGNGFFGDRNWGIGAPGKSSAEHSKKY
jgi:hypothetical protein